jgi:hypothetical protein
VPFLAVLHGVDDHRDSTDDKGEAEPQAVRVEPHQPFVPLLGAQHNESERVREEAEERHWKQADRDDREPHVSHQCDGRRSGSNDIPRHARPGESRAAAAQMIGLKRSDDSLPTQFR